MRMHRPVNLVEVVSTTFESDDEWFRMAIDEFADEFY